MKGVFGRILVMELFITRVFVFIVNALSMLIGCAICITAGIVDTFLPFLKLSDNLDKIINIFSLNSIIYVLSSFCDRQIYFHGELPDDISKESILVLCNHQSAADVPVITSIVYQFLKRHQNVRYLTKNSLCYIPLFGASLRYRSGMAFLRKNPKKDLSLVTTYTKTFISSRKNSTTIFFPEGTRLHLNDNLQKSSKFLESIGKKPTKYVLAPRLKGCCRILECSDGHIDSIIDVTICYRRMDSATLPTKNNVIAPSYFELIANNEIQIHVYIRKIPIEIINKQPNDGKFLYGLFEEKENFIKSVDETPLEFDVPKFNSPSEAEMAHSHFQKCIKVRKSTKKISNETKEDLSVDSQNSSITNSKNSSSNGTYSNDSTISNNNFAEINSFKPLTVPWLSPLVYVTISLLLLLLFHLILGPKNHIVLWLILTFVGYTRVIYGDLVTFLSN